MRKVHFSEELMKYIQSMDRDNSVVQFTIPRKGRCTPVLQEDEHSIKSDVDANPELEIMINESQKQYKKGLECPRLS
ncbi:hypothetical protein [Bacillus sp. 1NLA3E]|uniref:hypothetical protein n=1 Tax=Bacillus sp. 1NLA3E TaxID=666686 RepID=UPI000247F2F6|nr:hypothetical protein [Bacillus sp. 1NLA3E]AGK54077.1 hypothetical protein B1NLA3E_11635 [Bacillus sp. 1NLA3E]